MIKKAIKTVSFLVMFCVLLAVIVPPAGAAPVRKVTYSSYYISNIEGTKFCTVYFASGITAYNTYNLKESRDLLNSRIFAFSRNYGLGITTAQIASRTNICYANRVSYKSRSSIAINYP